MRRAVWVPVVTALSWSVLGGEGPGGTDERPLVNSIGMRMVRVEAGSFLMGSESGGNCAERPALPSPDRGRVGVPLPASRHLRTGSRTLRALSGHRVDRAPHCCARVEPVRCVRPGGKSVEYDRCGDDGLRMSGAAAIPRRPVRRSYFLSLLAASGVTGRARLNPLVRCGAPRMPLGGRIFRDHATHLVRDALSPLELPASLVESARAAQLGEGPARQDPALPDQARLADQPPRPAALRRHQW